MQDTSPEKKDPETIPEGQDGSAVSEEKAPAAEETPAPEETIADLEKQLADMKDAFLRAKAEGENIRRRAAEDVAKAHKFASEGFAKSMLAVKDSLEMALKTDAPTVESIKEGVDATLKQLSQVFEQNKISEVVPEQGEKLDPMKHQAIQAVDAPQDPNTVVSVLQKGYTLSGRLLRPAVVVVAASKKA